MSFLEKREAALQLRTQLESGGKRSPFWICGPCVIESHDILRSIAERVKEIATRHNVRMVFKASFDKANRSSWKSYRGRGIEDGLRELFWVKEQYQLPILTDIHEPHQAQVISEVADILQIPAFLCRQTDLLEAASKTGCLVNVKKGQFLAPNHLTEIVSKLSKFEASGFWITERGTSFGYERLVVDFAAFPEMERSGSNIIMDVTHAVQLPGSLGGRSGGLRESIPYLARAAAAVGVAGFFVETHPHPEAALSDSANAWPLGKLEELIERTREIAEIAQR